MSRISTLFLRVKDADEADYNKSVVRIHSADKPRDINWGDKIKISMNKKNWVTCKLEPAGDIGVGKIYSDIHLRGILNKDTYGVQTARLNVPCQFYVRKVSFWTVLLYIAIGIVIVIIIAVLARVLNQIGP